MMLNRIRGKKIWCRLFVSYFTIVLLLSGISLIVYYNAYTASKKRTIEFGDRMAKNYKNNVDSLYSDVEKLALQLMQEKRVQEVADYREPLNNEQMDEVMLLASDIKKYTIVRQDYSNVFIYFPNSNLIAHSNGIYDAYHFYKIYYKSQDFSYDDFINLLNTKRRADANLRSTVVAEAEYNQLVCVRESINRTKLDNIFSVGVCIPERQLFRNLDDNEYGQNRIFVLNTKKEILFSSDKAYNSIIESESIAIFDGESERINCGKDTYVCVKSDVADWYYIVVFPTDVLQNDVNNTKKLLIFNISAMLCIGLVLVVLFVRKNYKPINTLLERLSDTGVSLFESEDELEGVYKAVSKIYYERNTFEDLLDSQKEIIKLRSLEEILHGKSIDIEYLQEKCNVTFPFEFVTVCTFFCKNLDSLFGDEDDLTDFERKELFVQIIKNIGEELLNEKYKAYVVVADGVISCIVNVSDDRTECFFDDMSSYFSKMKNVLNNHFHIDLDVAVGELHQGLETVVLSYNEALRTIDYMTYMEIGGFVTYASIAENNQTEISFSIETEQRLMNCIISADFQKAESMINNVYKSVMINGNVTVKSANALLARIVNIFLTVMQNSHLNDFDDLYNSIGDFVEMIGTESFGLMQSKTIEIVRRICELIKLSKNKVYDRKIDEVVNYVKQNYSNPDLNVNLLADKFGYNAAYLSKIFKDEFGEALLYYINKIRIEKAKNLIRENNVTVEKISQMVGFNNTRTFNRAFQRYEGISPSAYSKQFEDTV